MNFIKYPKLSDSEALLSRPTDLDSAERRAKVSTILQAVRVEGDAAVRRFSAAFEGQIPDKFEVTAAEIAAAEHSLSADLKAAIRQAYANIKTFHAQQWEKEQRIETMRGVSCWRKSVPIDRVGLYIPGGTAPLFSTVLMLGIPAQLAGCQQVILCTPPQKEGKVHPAILFSAALCGIRQIFKVGGAQAIGAMAYGTDSVPRVWKIFGPGNSWVTAAKQLVSLDGVAIDLPAGPSEVCVIADSSANPEFVAADLLSQAEHGADSQVLLISADENLIREVALALENQLKSLPRMDFAQKALQNSHAILVHDLQQALDWSNAYAPEHLILAVEQAEIWASKVTDAGSVFLGHFTPESAGDYASGTNHTLPTNGYARAYSGVSLDSFLKKITFQQITREGLELLAPTVISMAKAEGLDAHAKAVEKRISALK